MSSFFLTWSWYTRLRAWYGLLQLTEKPCRRRPGDAQQAVPAPLLVCLLSLSLNFAVVSSVYCRKTYACGDDLQRMTLGSTGSEWLVCNE